MAGTKHPHMVEGRQVICWLLRMLNQYSLPEIAEMLLVPSMSHTTVWARIKVIEDARASGKHSVQHPSRTVAALTDDLLAELRTGEAIRHANDYAAWRHGSEK